MTVLDCGGRPLELGRTAIMGVLNITPDSFSDGGLFFTADQAVAQARKMVTEGADIIDIGGESTRPGAWAISVQQELDRVIPVIEALRAESDIPVSIDTSKAEVMAAAVSAGAGLINDVCALQGAGALEAAVNAGVPVCLMHMQGEPRTMQADPQYEDIVAAVSDFLQQRRQACIGAGIPADHILLDPGFGFGKAAEHNLELLSRLNKLVVLGSPVLVGLSRKSMIGSLLELPVEQRLYASVALALFAVSQGARIVRVHDVAATHQAVRMWESIQTHEA
ncbi:MAG: dihydropteroate synthase [Gammaproteobacteria bacterium]|nr:MAG: dihydropteroate synthase [Gammaproteobacteria bacterium]